MFLVILANDLSIKNFVEKLFNDDGSKLLTQREISLIVTTCTFKQLL